MTKHSLLSKTRKLLLPLIVLGCALLIWKHADLFATLLQISIAGLAAVILVKIFVALVNAMTFRVIIDLFSLKLSFKEWFGLTAVTIFYGRMLPGRVGFIPRAWYLKKHYSFKYSSYVSLLGGANIIDLFVNSILGLCFISFLKNSDSPYHPMVYSAFLLSLVIAVGGMIFMSFCRFLKIKTRWEKVDSLIKNVFEGFSSFQKRPRTLLLLVVVAASSIIAQSFALGVCFSVLGQTPPYFLLIVAFAAVNLSAVISITPGNIGITEGIIVGIMSLYNIPLELSVSASVLSRAASLAVQISLGLIYSYLIFGKVFDNKQLGKLRSEI